MDSRPPALTSGGFPFGGRYETAHPDSRLSREFMGIVAALRRRGKTVVIASHDPIVYEYPAVDRVVHIRDGRVDGGER